jgi:hypothetical protein
MGVTRKGTQTEAARRAGADRWQVRGVSVQGHHHLARGVECQDAHRSLLVPDAGAWVVAVSDGAGSRSRAAEGSALATGLATSVFGTFLRTEGVPSDIATWNAMLNDGYRSLLLRFERAVAQLGDEPEEFAATLSVAILAHPWVGLVSVGDGCLILQSGAGSLHLVSLGERQSEYSNETDFLTSPDPRSRTLISCIYEPELSGLFLSTDGLAPVATVLDPGGWERPNATFIEPLFESVGAPEFDLTEVVRFLLHDRIGGTSGDDKTMVVAVAR